MKTPINCSLCGKEFLIKSYRVAHSDKHYCSRKCSCQIQALKRWKNHKKLIKNCKHCNKQLCNKNKNGYCMTCFNKYGRICSDHTRKLLSQKRKEWLKNNPDKHPWKNKNKYKSAPCEKVKTFLIESGIQFQPEFDPKIDGRFFSIDIAIPDKMIALEINGNQHYERNGVLKPYYQERHDALLKAGWNVFEIHYSACFNLSMWAQFADTIKNSPVVKEFDYFNYKPTPKKEKPVYLCQCGKKITVDAKSCLNCRSISRRKITRPLKSELHYLIWDIPTTVLSKQFGVSDTAVAKWCKYYNISKPNRGYWEKYYAKLIIDYQI